MGYRRVSYAITWQKARVGVFHQRLSDVRWLVGTWEPFTHELTPAFLEAIASMPDKAAHELDTTGVPVSYTKLDYGKRTMHGMVQHLGAPLVLKHDPEMVIARYSEDEIEQFYRWQGVYCRRAS